MRSGSVTRLFGEAGAQHNLTATTAPTTADDNTKGRGPGSVWIDNSQTPKTAYYCLDGATNAAVWRAFFAAGGGGSMSGADIVAAINTALGDNTWQAGGGTMTGAAIVAALDAQLGSSGWQGGGTAGSTYPHGATNWVFNDFRSKFAVALAPFNLISLVSGSVNDGDPSGMLTGREGVVRFNAAAGGAGNSGVVLHAGARRLGVGDIVLDYAFSPTLIATHMARIGMDDSLGITDPNNGVYFKFTDGVVTAHVRSQNHATPANSSVAPITLTAAAWYRFLIKTLTATTTQFTIYNASTGASLWTETLTGNIPVDEFRDVYPILAHWASGTAGGILGNADYVGYGTTRVLPGRA
jgi:hypothetical protein